MAHPDQSSLTKLVSIELSPFNDSSKSKDNLLAIVGSSLAAVSCSNFSDNITGMPNDLGLRHATTKNDLLNSILTVFPKSSNDKDKFLNKILYKNNVKVTPYRSRFTLNAVKTDTDKKDIASTSSSIPTQSNVKCETVKSRQRCEFRPDFEKLAHYYRPVNGTYDFRTAHFEILANNRSNDEDLCCRSARFVPYNGMRKNRRWFYFYEHPFRKLVWLRCFVDNLGNDVSTLNERQHRLKTER